jgi:hypothetical protein
VLTIPNSAPMYSESQHQLTRFKASDCARLAHLPVGDELPCNDIGLRIDSEGDP